MCAGALRALCRLSAGTHSLVTLGVARGQERHRAPSSACRSGCAPPRRAAREPACAATWWPRSVRREGWATADGSRVDVGRRRGRRSTSCVRRHNEVSKCEVGSYTGTGVLCWARHTSFSRSLAIADPPALDELPPSVTRCRPRNPPRYPRPRPRRPRPRARPRRPTRGAVLAWFGRSARPRPARWAHLCITQRCSAA